MDQVFVDGRMMTLARFPNAGDDPFTPDTIEVTGEGSTVTASNITQAADSWKGATLWAMPGHQVVAGSAKVLASTNAVLFLGSRAPASRKGETRGYLEGVWRALDAENEWCQREGALYLWAPRGADPNTLDVSVSSRRWAFDLSGRSYIEVRGFRVLASSVNMDGADHCLLESCRFRWPSYRRDIRGGFNRDGALGITSQGLGIALGGHHNTVRACVVAYCLGDGISVYGASNTVENCVVHGCNLSASDCAPVAASGIGHTIARCTVYNAGRSGILHRKFRAGRIEHNHVYRVGLMTSDLGGTYTYGTDGKGTVIAYNRIHDVHCPAYGGSGIYLDNFNVNHFVHHNLCYDTQLAGIHVNTPTRHTRVVNNTLARSRYAIISGGSGPEAPPSFVVANNILRGEVRLKKGTSMQNNFRGKDPGFLAAGDGNYRLRRTSECIDAGAVVEGVGADFRGRAPDQGCFEFGLPAWRAGSTIPKELWDEAGW